MTTQPGLAAELLDRLPSHPAQVVPMVVVGTTPLRVQLNGDTTTNVPAIALSGVQLGTTGYAIWAPPLPPIVFGGTGSDTGWTSSGVSYGSGFSAGTGGQLEYRVFGNVVYLRGGADHTTDFADGSVVATLPAAASPGTQIRFMSFGALRRAVSVDVATNGQITAGFPDPPGVDTPWPSSWVGLSAPPYLTD